MALASKVTYIGPGEGNWTYKSYTEEMDGAENLGWLVDLTRGDEEKSGIPLTEGRYQRLLFDASVQTKRMGKQVIDENGNIARGVKFAWYFADFD